MLFAIPLLVHDLERNGLRFVLMWCNWIGMGDAASRRGLIKALEATMAIKVRGLLKIKFRA